MRIVTEQHVGENNGEQGKGVWISLSEDGCMTHFPNLYDAIITVQQMLNMLKEAKPLDDWSNNEIEEFINDLSEDFCAVSRGEVGIIRMKRTGSKRRARAISSTSTLEQPKLFPIQAPAQAYLYKECDSDDKLTEPAAKFEIPVKVLGDTPPEFVTIRFSRSEPMN